MTENTFLTRYDEHGPLRCIAYAEGYVMVRRKGSGPVLMHIGKWLKMSVKQSRDSAAVPPPEQAE